MEKILRDIAKILNFSDSFFGEVENLGKLGFYETNLKSGRFKASGNFKKLFNLPEGRFYNVGEFQELIHPFDVERVLQDFNACMKERRSFDNEYRVLIKGNVHYIRERSVFTYDDDGAPFKVVGMRQDITEEKLAEMERKQYVKELEQAHETVTTIVHDLKAPMHNIRMITDLLKENADEKNVAMIEKLEESCQHSFEIIDDVLEKSSVEEKDDKVKKEYCDIHKLVGKAVSTLYYTAQKKNIKILTSLQPNTYAFVHPKKLQRALENLLSNAVKFSHRNGKVEVSLYGNGNSLFIKVEDFGLGMDDHQKALLFQKDPLIGKEGTFGEKSSGLGMNIVKGILHQHGGDIMVESKESVGTKFLIELPKE